MTGTLLKRLIIFFFRFEKFLCIITYCLSALSIHVGSTDSMLVVLNSLWWWNYVCVPIDHHCLGQQLATLSQICANILTTLPLLLLKCVKIHNSQTHHGCSMMSAFIFPLATIVCFDCSGNIDYVTSHT